jgi:predicted nucleic acid-binding protein
MIAGDTSSLIEYLAGGRGPDIEAIDRALALGELCIPPVVITELLSGGDTPARLERVITSINVLDLTEGYWQRAGQIRAVLRARGHRAPLADALICQSCLDYDVALITRDADFRMFAKSCGLKLA